MPWIVINLMEGCSPQQKQALHNKVAAAVVETLNVPPEWVKIQLTEMASENHSIGGVPVNALNEK